MIDFAMSEWDRARRTLRTARQLIESDPESCVSRAYYAAFHAVTAYMALQGRKFSKHTALRAAVHRDLVHTGMFPEAFGQDFDLLVNLRDTSDYGASQAVSAQDAEIAVAKADAIVNALVASEPRLPL